MGKGIHRNKPQPLWLTFRNTEPLHKSSIIKDNYHATAPSWSLFPKTSLLQTLLLVNINKKKKREIWNPLSPPFWQFDECPSLPQNATVSAHNFLINFFSLLAQPAALSPAQRKVCYRHNSLVWTAGLSDPLLLGHRLHYQFSPLPYKNLSWRSLGQRDTAPTRHHINPSVSPALPKLPFIHHHRFPPWIPKMTNRAALLRVPRTWTLIYSVEGDTAAYFHGLFWMLLLLSMRDPAVLGRLGLLRAVVALESRPEEPRLRRPEGKGLETQVEAVGWRTMTYQWFAAPRYCPSSNLIDPSVIPWGVLGSFTQAFCSAQLKNLQNQLTTKKT